ncbi:MAG: HhH-GPD family protein [Candidatus Aquicultorales bacterium]
MSKTGKFSDEAVEVFHGVVYDYYRYRGRSLPWRDTADPYRILVSEIMLQQTQAERVISKYEELVAHFPGFRTLAEAPLREVLAAWQGLGYNRRGLALQRTARLVVEEHAGKLPADHRVLETFPGIGKATAASICAFAFGLPTVFIETNIRAVFIHFFFEGRAAIPDREILPLVEKTLDKDNPREWYYALMDYGVRLKKEHKNPSRKSAHYKRQSPLEGSNRQLRSRIIKTLLQSKALGPAELEELLEPGTGRVPYNLLELTREGLIREEGGLFMISE